MKVTVELVAIELPQFGGARSRAIDLAAGATMLDALSMRSRWTATRRCSP